MFCELRKCWNRVVLLGLMSVVPLGCTENHSPKITPPPYITWPEGKKMVPFSSGGPPKVSPGAKDKSGETQTPGKQKDTSGETQPAKEKAPDGKPDSSAKPGDKTSSSQDGAKKPEKP